MQLDDSDGALGSWARFCALSGELVGGAGDLSVDPRLAPVVADLCARGLATLVRDYFLHNLEGPCTSIVEAGADLSAGDGAMYARVAVEEDDAVLLGEIARRGGDVAVACYRDGTTPLHRAVLDGNARMVRVLLEHGADPDRADARGLTPTALAYRHAHADIQQLFSSHRHQDQQGAPKPPSTEEGVVVAPAAPRVTRFRSAPSARVLLPSGSVGPSPSPNRAGRQSNSSSARSTPQRMASFRNSLFGVISSSFHGNRHDGGGGTSFHHRHERNPSSHVRVTISCPEQGRGERRLLVFVPETMLQLLELGGNRFGFAAMRVITSDGAEIDDVRLVRDGDHLLLVSDQWAPDTTSAHRNQ